MQTLLDNCASIEVTRNVNQRYRKGGGMDGPSKPEWTWRRVGAAGLALNCLAYSSTVTRWGGGMDGPSNHEWTWRRVGAAGLAFNCLAYSSTVTRWGGGMDWPSNHDWTWRRVGAAGLAFNCLAIHPQLPGDSSRRRSGHSMKERFTRNDGQWRAPRPVSSIIHGSDPIVKPLQQAHSSQEPLCSAPWMGP